MPSDAATQPTFTYRGRSFFWGYSPDRQTCGLWSVEDPAGEPHQTWPISEHEAAWRVFRSMEPHASEYTDPDAVASVEQATPADSLVSPDSALGDNSSTSILPAGNAGNSGNSGNPANSAGAPYVTHFITSRKRLRMLAVVALVSAAVALAAVLGVRAFGSNPSSPSADRATEPSQVVLTAATATQHLNTAEMNMTETVTVGSQTVTVPVSGVVDFASGSGSLSMTVDGQHFTVVSSGGSLYMSIPDISEILPGKSWVLVPITSSEAAAGGALSGGDPAQMLQFLASRGNTVTSLGPTTLGGVPVQAYSVLIDKSAVQSALAGSGLPAQVVQAADQFLQSVGPISFKVYVDSANQLRGMDFSMSIPGSSGGTVSADMTFSDFGVPVSVAQPPASQVATLQQFLAATQQAVNG